MSSGKSEQDILIEETWRGYLTGEHHETPAVPRRLMLALRHIFKRMPADHRCQDCHAPFHGPIGLILRPFGFSVKSDLSPKICAA